MKKYTYLVNFDSQTLERVGESFAVKGDGGIAELEFVIPSNFGVPANQALWRVFFKLPGEKGSLFETLPTVAATQSGDYVTAWVISKAITQKAGQLAFSLAAISGNDIQWNSRTVIMQVPESQYQPESEEAEEPYTGRLTALEGDIAAIRGEFAEVQDDFEELKETATLGTPIPESLVDNMTEGHVYIYTGTEPDYTAGHVYYYVNGTLTDGGVYGGTFAAIKESKMVSITWAELKALRDDGQLIPGQTYRITDYICTTTQEGSRVESHPYDIIVTADSETALSEIARACVHDAASAEYYQYAHIEAWELKYSLDNNARRFAWADGENGRGVVYYLKDDHGNECPYDFKQIQFARYPITACTVSSLVGKYAALQHGKAITGIDKQNPVWCYTFSYDPESTGIMSDASVMEFNTNNNADVSWNIIKPIYSYQNPGEEAGLQIALLNCIVLFGNICQSNTFGNNCSFNTFGNTCQLNTFGNYYSGNTFGNTCQLNTFGNYCSYNTFGNSCQLNTFGNNYSGNTFGNTCLSNTFGNNCSFNTFGNSCRSNTFGDDCSTNTFGNTCQLNTFGDDCSTNTFGDFCAYNTFGNYCSYIDVLTGTSSQKQKRYYNVLDGVQGTNRFHISITGTGGNNFVTYVGKNSSGELKTWVPADLVQ